MFSKLSQIHSCPSVYAVQGERSSITNNTMLPATNQIAAIPHHLTTARSADAARAVKATKYPTPYRGMMNKPGS